MSNPRFETARLFFGAGFRQFDHVNMPWAVHVRAEDQPLVIRREDAIGLEIVIVIGKAHEFLRAQDAGLHLSRRLVGEPGSLDQLWSEQIHPLTVGGRIEQAKVR